VTAARDQREVLAAGERGRHVAADERVAEAEALDGRRDRPGEVEPQHPRRVVHHDLDIAGLVVRDHGCGQRLLGPGIERLDLGIRQHSRARPLVRTRVVEQVKFCERRLARDRRGGGSG
jgi:hypothetical protein